MCCLVPAVHAGRGQLQGLMSNYNIGANTVLQLSHNMTSSDDYLYKGGSLRSCILCTPCGRCTCPSLNVSRGTCTLCRTLAKACRFILQQGLGLPRTTELCFPRPVTRRLQSPACPDLATEHTNARCSMVLSLSALAWPQRCPSHWPYSVRCHNCQTPAIAASLNTFDTSRAMSQIKFVLLPG